MVDDKARAPERDGHTLGVLITAHRDDEVVRYALGSSVQPLAVTAYQTLPAEVRPLLPGPEQLAPVTHEVLETRGGERGGA